VTVCVCVCVCVCVYVCAHTRALVAVYVVCVHMWGGGFTALEVRVYEACVGEGEGTLCMSIRYMMLQWGILYQTFPVYTCTTEML